MSNVFTLDPRLAADTVAVTRLPLCDVRLMNDARFAWLVLVPRRIGMVEISDLSDTEQAMLWHESLLAGAALRATCPCDKLNLGALGNIVRQLHLHVVARHRGDAAWPGPVWGHGVPAPYATDSLSTRIAALQAQPWGQGDQASGA
jgi:diadenosine tetraphosphate (Ap4A) HIT family hydrolase